MPAPSSLPELFDLIEKSGLLGPAELERCARTSAALGRDPAEAAATLVRAGILTAFQARQLLAGKYRGMVLGPYRLLRRIGQGGMGAVFLAEHTGMRRRAALKVLPRERCRDRTALKRFLREARAAAALDHPNLVRAYDVGQAYGVHFLVMEYVEGHTLEAERAAGPAPYPRAVGYAVQAATGLLHAHERGFVHRDVKPANLIVTPSGVVKVLDMGLARSFVDDGDNLTGLFDPAAVVGTPDYMAPEQALNQTQDARTDVYALGATLYALAAGRPPFDGGTARKLIQHQLRDPPPLATAAPATPAGLSEVVARMMAKRPGDRFQSMAEVIDALAPWAAEPASTSTPGSSGVSRAMTSRQPPPPRRWPRWVVPTFIAVTLLAIAVLVWAAS